MPIGADKSSPAQLVEGTSPSSPSVTETSPQTELLGDTVHSPSSPSVTETSPQAELLGDTVHSEPSSPPREQLSSPSPRPSSSPPLPQPQSGVHPHHDDEWANLPWLHPGLYTCVALYALMWGLWVTWQLTHSARTIPTQLAVAWYSLLNCALAPIQWVTRSCLNTWAPKAAVADSHVKSEVPTTHQRDPLADMTSLELANACKSNRRPRRVPSVRTTPVDHRSRRNVSPARSSSTPSTCSSGSDGKCTASRTAGTREWISWLRLSYANSMSASSYHSRVYPLRASQRSINLAWAELG